MKSAFTRDRAQQVVATKWFQHGTIGAFLEDEQIYEINSGEFALLPTSQDAIVAHHRLEYVADYRTTLRTWMEAVKPGGHLVIAVPHCFLYERQLALPSRWAPDQRRLYSPASLLQEVEEALAPNSYRVRLLADDDVGYDYSLPNGIEPSGNSDIVLVLEKTAPPGWSLDASAAVSNPSPDYSFEPERTRVEMVARQPAKSILVLKLDHLGDFIMGIPALKKLRATFPGAHITLAVGTWNQDMACSLGLADTVTAFDAFPRNSSEEEVDVPGKAAMFAASFAKEYDLAIDLRTDVDTRPLLRLVKAKTRAGIGTKARFPFLDIFLPLDWNRNEPEAARQEQLTHFAFACQGSAVRSDYRISSTPDRIERDCAIVWGPYRRLRAGRYFFEPFIELADDTRGGILMLDIALDGQRVTQTMLPASERPRVHFTVEKAGTEFEFRIWSVEDLPTIALSFFGGRLVREGANSVLHQSEYLSLLIELIAMRMAKHGTLSDDASA